MQPQTRGWNQGHRPSELAGQCEYGQVDWPPPRDDRAVFQFDERRGVLVADDFARFGDVHQQFARGELVGGQREVGAGDSPFASEQMAGGATGLAIERLAARQIAFAFQQWFDFEKQLFGVPILDEQPRGQRRLGAIEELT